MLDANEPFTGEETSLLALLALGHVLEDDVDVVLGLMSDKARYVAHVLLGRPVTGLNEDLIAIAAGLEAWAKTLKGEWN